MCDTLKGMRFRICDFQHDFSREPLAAVFLQAPNGATHPFPHLLLCSSERTRSGSASLLQACQFTEHSNFKNYLFLHVQAATPSAVCTTCTEHEAMGERMRDLRSRPMHLHDWKDQKKCIRLVCSISEPGHQKRILLSSNEKTTESKFTEREKGMLLMMTMTKMPAKNRTKLHMRYLFNIWIESGQDGMAH